MNNTQVIKTAALLLLLWNIFALALMGWDKRNAKKGKRRIAEKTLLMMAFLFGGCGIAAGMLFYRHKTLKWKFRLLVPAGMVVNFMLLWVMIYGRDYY